MGNAGLFLVGRCVFPATQSQLLANVFYEASTRTSCSFAAAAMRLGGNVVPVTGSSSSVTKGESLEDTIRTLACYCDAIVLRHPSVGAAVQAAAASPVPVLNAGDGAGEHPTQALLDLLTVVSERGKPTPDGLRITMLGDLKHGRTVHSLSKLLSLYDVSLTLVAPDELQMPPSIVDRVRAAGRTVALTHELSDELLAATDVLYVTRVQKERFSTPEAYAKAKGTYVVNAAAMAKLPADAVVMHPLPRVDEIHPEVDSDPRAAYFRQMRYGLFMRMALLRLLLGI
jgi:aspartate carbamoyltransferase